MHEEYQLSVFDRGIGELAYRGKREFVGPTQVNVFAPGEVHDAECANPWDLRSVYVSVAVIRDVAEQLGCQHGRGLYFRQCVIENHDLRIRFRQFFDAIGNPITRLSADSILLSCLTFLFERFAATALHARDVGREPSAVMRCREFLESHYSDEVPLEMLAEISGLSAFHLIRSFKRRFGVPPHAFQIGLRLNRAKAALQNGATPTEAAVANGFFDQSHLHRCFRLSFGVTPHQYRQMVGNEISGEFSLDAGKTHSKRPCRSKSLLPRKGRTRR